MNSWIKIWETYVVFNWLKAIANVLEGKHLWPFHFTASGGAWLLPICVGHFTVSEEITLSPLFSSYILFKSHISIFISEWGREGNIYNFISSHFTQPSRSLRWFFTSCEMIYLKYNFPTTLNHFCKMELPPILYFLTLSKKWTGIYSRKYFRNLNQIVDLHLLMKPSLAHQEQLPIFLVKFLFNLPYFLPDSFLCQLINGRA